MPHVAMHNEPSPKRHGPHDDQWSEPHQRRPILGVIAGRHCMPIAVAGNA